VIVSTGLEYQTSRCVHDRLKTVELERRDAG